MDERMSYSEQLAEAKRSIDETKKRIAAMEEGIEQTKKLIAQQQEELKSARKYLQSIRDSNYFIK